jgi:hypothetical protein
METWLSTRSVPVITVVSCDYQALRAHPLDGRTLTRFVTVVRIAYHGWYLDV